MALYGIVQVNDGSDAYLERMLELARRLSSRRSVLLRLEPRVRPKVETMLGTRLTPGERARISVMDANDDAMVPAVQAAGFCVFSDREMTAHLREDQVAVCSPSWVA